MRTSSSSTYGVDSVPLLCKITRLSGLSRINFTCVRGSIYRVHFHRVDWRVLQALGYRDAGAEQLVGVCADFPRAYHVVPTLLLLCFLTIILQIIGVPVGLPCVTTTTMAVGAAYLAKQQAIVQKLTAIESLAVSVIPRETSRNSGYANYSHRESTYSAPTRLVL